MPFQQTGRNLHDIAKDIRAFKRDKLGTLVGIEAVKFFEYSFRRQGFINTALVKWQPRKRDDTRRPGRKTLVDTGRLWRSIRVVKKGNGFVTIGTDVPYAQIHNEGGQVNASQTVRSHTRKAHTRSTKDGVTVSVKEHQVSSHQRIINFQMPQRQFMGDSEFLRKRLRMIVAFKMRKIFNGDRV